VLREKPSARILVTCQANDPLDHLLARVDQAMRENRRKLGSRDRIRSNNDQLAVRVVSGHAAVDANDSIAEHLPSNIVTRLLREATTKEWPNQIMFKKVGMKWLDFLQRNHDAVSVEIQHRILSVANLVFATANDRFSVSYSDHPSFDLVVFEEAAKAYTQEVLSPMGMARRWILIGDQLQLPPFKLEEFRSNVDTVIRQKVAEHSIRSALTHDEKERIVRQTLDIADFFPWLFEKGLAQKTADRLTLQWRMHSDIGDLLAATYYRDIGLQNGSVSEANARNQLSIKSPEFLRDNHIVWIDTPSYEHDKQELFGELPAYGGGHSNRAEERIIWNILRNIDCRHIESVMLLSPYRAQYKRLHDLIGKWRSDRVRAKSREFTKRISAMTVDSAQGREAKLVIVSLVRNNRETREVPAFGFLDRDQRSAVMFSRAESILVVVGCSEHFAKHRRFHLNDVYRHIDKHGAVVDARTFMSRDDFEWIRQQQKHYYKSRR